MPKSPWTEELQTIADSAKCIQRDPFRRDIEIEGSEDCLYLNVYTPTADRVGHSRDDAFAHTIIKHSIYFS